MGYKQQSLIISADNRANKSNTDWSNFTIRLESPIENVVRIDLRCVSLNLFSGGFPTFTNSSDSALTCPWLGIQSAQLGDKIICANNIALFDIVPIISTQAIQFYERTESKGQNNEFLYSKPTNLYQIDIKMVNKDGSQPGNIDATDSIDIFLQVITEEAD